MVANNAQNNMLGRPDITPRTAGATYNLSVNSNYFQIFTGNNLGAVDEVILPDTSTLEVGRQFYILATGVGALSIKTFDGNQIIDLSRGNRAKPLVVTCASTSTNNVFAWGCDPLIGTSGSYTPTVSFTTPGDLSVTYDSQSCQEIISGNIKNVVITVHFTPTYTTSSGSFIIQNIPPLLGADSVGLGGILIRNGIGGALPASPFSYPSTATSIVPLQSATTIVMRGLGSGLGAIDCGTIQFTSGDRRFIKISLTGRAF